MMELTEDFLKLIQIALIVVGALSIFFTYVTYNIIIRSNEAEREALVLGNALLSSDCLIYSDTRSLFSQDKLINMGSDPSCLKYPYGSVTVELVNAIPPHYWSFKIKDPVLDGEADFSVAVRLNTGEIKQALMKVKV
jgi:hypothetical protein